MTKKLLLFIMLSIGLPAYAMEQDLNKNLHDAAVKGDVKLVNRLLDEGADIQSEPSYPWGPLYINVMGLQIPSTFPLGAAMQFGQVETVQLLISRGAQLPTRLKLPESWKRKDWKELILNETKKIGRQEQFIRAAENGNLDELCQLLANGAKINEKGIFDSLALGQAAQNGHLEAVKFLLQKGALINEQTQNNDTAIRLAASKNHYAVVAYLLAHGANPNIHPRTGWAPNAYNGAWDPRVARLLIRHGADVFDQSLWGSTKLAFAVRDGAKEMVLAILTAIPKPDAQLIRDHYFSAMMTLAKTPNKPSVSRDVRRLIGKQIIDRLEDEQIERQISRIQKLLSITDDRGQTAQQIALSFPRLETVPATQQPERKKTFLEIADLFDLNNPNTQRELRRKIRKDILDILFGEQQ